MTERQRNRLRAACRQIANDLAQITACLESIRGQLRTTDRALAPEPDGDRTTDHTNSDPT